MHLSRELRIFLCKAIFLFTIFNMYIFSATKMKLLKNFDIRSDSAVCYENIFELHFLQNVIAKSSNLNLKTDKLIINFSDGFKDVVKLNLVDNIDGNFDHKYRFFVKRGRSVFFNNVFSFCGDNAHFLIRSFSEKSDMILKFCHCDMYFDEKCSNVKKIIFKNNVICFVHDTLFVGKTAEYNADSNIIVISGDVCILDKADNYVISEKVGIDIENGAYKVFGVKDGYKKI